MKKKYLHLSIIFKKLEMKKTLFVCLILWITNLTNAQEISYGPIIGNSFYGIGNNNGTYSFGSDKTNAIYFGAYAEYNFTNNVGIKTELLFNKKEALYSPYFLSEDIKFDFSFVEINPSFKYDFGQEYREGFYMLVGPKISLITKATSEGEDVKDDFETFIYGAQLGFGYRIFKFIDIQTKLEYDIAPFIKFEDNKKSHFFGANLSLNIDVERLISQN